MLQEAINKQYADYGYYSKIFCGTAIPAAKFPRYARQAQAFIDRITFGRVQKLIEIPEEVKDAVCAAAEVAYENGKKSAIIKSENIDGYAVTYGDTDSKSTNAEMYAAASSYLANTGLMFRGRERKKKHDHEC